TSYAAGVPHCLRRLDSTKHYPADKDNEVHDDGEMWSATLFQIRTAFGAARADRLILQAHFLLSTRANFSDGSNALVTAAINLGFTAAEVTSPRTILSNRGFTVTAEPRARLGLVRLLAPGACTAYNLCMQYTIVLEHDLALYSRDAHFQA